MSLDNTTQTLDVNDESKNYLKSFLLTINKLCYNLNPYRIEHFVNLMNIDDINVVKSFLSEHDHSLLKTIPKFFKKSRLNNTTKLSKNEEFVFSTEKTTIQQSFIIHIVKTISSTEYIYRAELRKKSKYIYDFTFGACYNYDNNTEKCYNLMKNKLLVFHKEKNIFILDRRGFTYNENMAIAQYYPNDYTAFDTSQSRKHLKLFRLSLQRVFPDYNIYFYNCIYINVYQLVLFVFNYIINYPSELEYFFDPLIVTKINSYNYPYFNFDMLIKFNRYDTLYINELIIKCAIINYINYGMIAVWFEYDRNYSIFSP